MNAQVFTGDMAGLAESQKAWKDAALAQGSDWTKRDVAQANRMMDEAGLARGSDGIRVVSGSGPMRYEIQVVQGWTDLVSAAGIIQQNPGESGIAASVKPLEYNGWIGNLKQGDVGLILGLGSRRPTPYQFYLGPID